MCLGGAEGPGGVLLYEIEAGGLKREHQLDSTMEGRDS